MWAKEVVGIKTLHLVGPTAELHPVTQKYSSFWIPALGTSQIWGSHNISTWIARLGWLKKIFLACLILKKNTQAWYHMGSQMSVYLRSPLVLK